MPLSPPEMEAITADLVAHNKDCYEKTLIELGLEPKPEEHDDTEETEDIEPPADSSDGNDPPIEVKACSDGDGQKKNPLQVLLFCPIFILLTILQCHQDVIWRWLSLSGRCHQVGWDTACSPVAVFAPSASLCHQAINVRKQ